MILPRGRAVLFSVWCATVSVVVLPSIIPGITSFEFAVSAILVVFVFITGWRLVGRATDVLIRSEESHRLLLEGSPVAILEEDYSKVASRLAELRDAGLIDLEGYLCENPAELRHLASSIRIRRANERAGSLSPTSRRERPSRSVSINSSIRISAYSSPSMPSCSPRVRC